jgi:hypothetical protein
VPTFLYGGNGNVPKVSVFRDILNKLQIKFLYINDLILRIAAKDITPLVLQ